MDFLSVLGIVSKERFCNAIGVSLRSVKRWKLNGISDRRKGAKKNVHRKLSEEETEVIYRTLCSPEYCDQTPAEAFATLLDKGVYLASVSTLYRILRSKNAVKHRTEQKEPGTRKKPAELKASGPHQVWMWDITYLKSPVKGIYYYAYVIEDLYDRSIVAWGIYENESDKHARELFEYAVKNEGDSPDFVHSDNGNPMKGVTLLEFFYKLNIGPSYSRPHVSDDNPYIESLFHTVKYCRPIPTFFNDISHARTWFADFTNWYNNKHLHSSLQYVTPFQRRQGLHIEILRHRNEVIKAAREKYPERWGVRISKEFKIPTYEILNPDKKITA